MAQQMAVATDNIDISGTSMCGYITIPKYKLEELFGPSLGPSGDNKVLDEWNLEITDQNGDTHIATIYDWKNYEMTSLPPDYSDWHIGGHSRMAPTVLRELIMRLNHKTITHNQE